MSITKRRSASPYSKQTQLIQLAQQVDLNTHGIGPVIDTSVTYAVQTTEDAFGSNFSNNPRGYSAYYNPTVSIVENMMGVLEGSQHVLAVNNGRDAIARVFDLLPKDSHVIVTPNDLYPGTRNIFKDRARRTGLSVTYVDEISYDALEKAHLENTALILTETITNPRLNVPDYEIITNFARDKGILSLADNTAPTPIAVRPFEHGFDLVVHSGVKMLTGRNNKSIGFILINDDIAKSTFISEKKNIFVNPDNKDTDIFTGLKNIRDYENGLPDAFTAYSTIHD